jgi:hypothetical protein
VSTDDKDWCAAACADALVEGLRLSALATAHEVAETPEDFYWAVHAAIKLKDCIDAFRACRNRR